MPSPAVDQNLCTGSQECSSMWPNVFGFDTQTNKAFVKSGATCNMISATEGCDPAVNACPAGAIYHVD